VRPEDLTIDRLIARVAEGGIDEVVLAMNATLEGQTTAHYIAERLEGYPVRITQLAHGLPVGGELDYLDEGTLAQALRARRPVGMRPCERGPTRYICAPWLSAKSSKCPIRASRVVSKPVDPFDDDSRRSSSMTCSRRCTMRPASASPRSRSACRCACW
jgi:hypothetical protein